MKESMKFCKTQLKSRLLVATLANIFPLLLIASPIASAQVYKWVGPDGKLNFTDTPPPANVKLLETRQLSIDAGIPYDLAAAMAKNPVVLYTSTPCNPCSEARSMLKSQGVPFLEKIVKSNEDIQKLREISGDTQLPVMIINTTKFAGFDRIGWRAALSSAGYPETSMLPKEYRFQVIEGLVPVPPAPVKQVEVRPEVKIKPATESGIRF